MTNSNDDFFANAPQDYEVPKGDTKYLKFKEPGQYKFRILEKPVFGWEGWKIIDGKDTPFRFALADKPKDTTNFKNGELNHFWAMAVYSFNDERVMILSFTTKSIQQAIERYARDEEWGSPLGYNITVTREGTKKNDTKYNTIASPHSELDEEAKKAWDEVKFDGFDINELFHDADPFAPQKREEARVEEVDNEEPPE